jgi:hypothetical protein
MSGVIAPAAEAAALAGPLRPRRRRVFRLRSFTLGSLKAFVFVRSSSSLVLAPLRFALMGFLPVDDERIARTIAAIESELMEDGFVRRLKPHDAVPEGAFLACSCWLADCQQLQGRRDAARQTFERMLSVRNELGLLSEEYNVKARHLAGNFPQALSHLALVRTALRLSMEWRPARMSGNCCVKRQLNRRRRRHPSRMRHRIARWLLFLRGRIGGEDIPISEQRLGAIRGAHRITGCGP